MKEEKGFVDGFLMAWEVAADVLEALMGIFNLEFLGFAVGIVFIAVLLLFIAGMIAAVFTR